MVWVADVAVPPEAPFAQVHVLLYAYFPWVRHGEPRPYVFRWRDRGTVAVCSQMRPAAPAVREAVAREGATYDFALTFNRVRNVSGSYRRPDGTWRKRPPRAVVIEDHAELKARVTGFAAGRGGDVRYVRVERPRVLRVPGRFEVPIADAVGKVVVTDADRFNELLWRGGPGTSKAFGCGMWWLPELMGAAA
jgi:hypothetical protein